ncbi:21775_t:CDS:1, partial [Gigaspora margarita]
LQKGHWYKDNSMGYGKLRKMMNNIATHTGINLSNRQKITNCSCNLLIKNNGLLDSDLQMFSGH